MTQFKMVEDKILVKPEPLQQRTPAGILLPESKKSDGPREGKVIAVGPGISSGGKTMPVNVEVGATILYSPPYDDLGFTFDDVKYHVIDESDILVILE